MDYGPTRMPNISNSGRTGNNNDDDNNSNDDGL